LLFANPFTKLLVGGEGTMNLTAVDELAAGATKEVRNMLKWLHAGGASWLQGVRIEEVFPGERGLVAHRSLDRRQHGVLEIPLRFAFSPEHCLHNSSTFAMQLSANFRERLSKSHALLHLCFLEHFLLLREVSEFAPYFDTLPTNLDHLPLMSPLNVTDLMMGSPLLADIQKHHRDLQNMYDEIAWQIPRFSTQISLHDFLRTYCLVESHSHARHEGNSSYPLMVPLVDLVNHRSKDYNLQLGSATGSSISVNVGRRAISTGEQMFFRYSDDEEASSKIFKQFGFIDDELPVVCKLAFPLRRHHPLYEEKKLMFDEGLVRVKKMILQAAGPEDLAAFGSDAKVYDFPKFVLWFCKPAHANFSVRRPQIIEEELVPFARFVVFDGSMSQLRADCDMKQTPPACTSPLSASQEATAIRFLLDTVQEHLKRYPTSAEDDDRTLLGQQLQPQAKPYIRMRRDEKRCLSQLARLIEPKALVGHHSSTQINTSTLHIGPPQPALLKAERGRSPSSITKGSTSSTLSQEQPLNRPQWLSDSSSTTRPLGISKEAHSRHDHFLVPAHRAAEGATGMKILILVGLLLIACTAFRRRKRERHVE